MYLFYFIYRFIGHNSKNAIEWVRPENIITTVLLRWWGWLKRDNRDDTVVFPVDFRHSLCLTLSVPNHKGLFQRSWRDSRTCWDEHLNNRLSILVFDSFVHLYLSWRTRLVLMKNDRSYGLHPKDTVVFFWSGKDSLLEMKTVLRRVVSSGVYQEKNFEDNVTLTKLRTLWQSIKRVSHHKDGTFACVCPPGWWPKTCCLFQSCMGHSCTSTNLWWIGLQLPHRQGPIEN